MIIVPQYGLTQIIHEPVHLLDCSALRIDLIFISQDNLESNFGINSSLHSNCHHQTFFSEYNLKIHYPPPFINVLYENMIKLIRISQQKPSTIFIGTKSSQRMVICVSRPPAMTLAPGLKLHLPAAAFNSYLPE